MPRRLVSVLAKELVMLGVVNMAPFSRYIPYKGDK